MAHLDLEEQEQLDQLKHFWNTYGNLISWILIAVFGSIAAWNGWNYWERRQAAQASYLYEEVERAAVAGEAARVEQAFKDMREKFGRTTYAQQAGLLAGRVLAERGRPDAAKTALQWVATDGGDEGMQAIARLRLAGLLVETKDYEGALRQLNAGMPREFEPLAADRRGDVYNLQGQKDQAKLEYMKAWQGFTADSQYRPLVEVKLTALGVDVNTLKPAGETAKS
jgi:predicted negative regulator of RcsB-dependent stress response